MNKTKIFLFIFIFSAVLSAFPVQYEHATRAAEAKLQQIDRGQELSIAGSLEIAEDITLAWAFILEPQGYIVVTADRRLPIILAYSTSSSFGENCGNNILFDMVKYDLISRLENIDLIADEIVSYRQAQWDKIIGGESVFSHPLERWPPEGTTANDGWIDVRWGQSSPYNQYCPLDPVTGTRSYAGCPSVAMAQIVDYHRTTNMVEFGPSDEYFHNFGSRRYWIDRDADVHDFPNFERLNELLDTVQVKYVSGIPLDNSDIAALIFACGVAAKQVYSSSASGTFGVSQAMDAFRKFNFDDAVLLTEDDEDVWTRLADNMMLAKPAHIAVVTPAWDSGHNMAVDGYDSEGFFHVNFGWTGSHDGWYRLPDDIPFGLTVLEGVIVDILATCDFVHEVPEAKSIMHISPNPFNSKCTFVFSGERLSNPVLRIYDIRGSKVFETRDFAGSVIWDASSQQSGIYFATITDGDFSQSRRLVYIR